MASTCAGGEVELIRNIAVSSNDGESPLSCQGCGSQFSSPILAAMKNTSVSCLIDYLGYSFSSTVNLNFDCIAA